MEGKISLFLELLNTSFVHNDVRDKNILVMGEEPTQNLDNATITAEAKNRIIIIESGKRSALSLHYN